MFLLGLVYEKLCMDIYAIMRSRIMSSDVPPAYVKWCQSRQLCKVPERIACEWWISRIFNYWPHMHYSNFAIFDLYVVGLTINGIPVIQYPGADLRPHLYGRNQVRFVSRQDGPTRIDREHFIPNSHVHEPHHSGIYWATCFDRAPNVVSDSFQCSIGAGYSPDPLQTRCLKRVDWSLG